ncbi:MAG: hypothetical protein HY455_02170 [Parcubacteria group bacterium]|nr:hypothetical protein [Parcubacteria group bacterium]
MNTSAQPNAAPNVAELRAFFKEFGPEEGDGIVALIDVLDTPEGRRIPSLGSSSIVFPDDPGFRSVYIGSLDGSVTPLQWIAMLKDVYRDAPPLGRKRLSTICAEFAAFHKAKPVGNVSIARKDGTFSVPAEAWNPDMTDEALEPYRTQHLGLG